MGYELHIVRTRLWIDAEDDPIDREEWNDYARSHPRLTEAGWVGWTDIGREPVYEFVDNDGEKGSLSWRNGDIRVAAGWVEAAELVAIAADFGAMVIGDDNELYVVDDAPIPYEG